jgi:hypothetical protein
MHTLEVIPFMCSAALGRVSMAFELTLIAGFTTPGNTVGIRTKLAPYAWATVFDEDSPLSAQIASQKVTEFSPP